METLLIAIAAVAAISVLALLTAGTAALGRRLRGTGSMPATVEGQAAPAPPRAA
jgi:hypothetical protein